MARNAQTSRNHIARTFPKTSKIMQVNPFRRHDMAGRSVWFGAQPAYNMCFACRTKSIVRQAVAQVGGITIKEF